MYPTSGEEFNTKFEITALESGGWSDPDGDDITFEFGYEISSGERFVLGERQSSKTFEGAVLPNGMFVPLTYSYKCFCDFFFLFLNIDVRFLYKCKRSIL